tara:strand:- start:6645 stop:6824 length:180 start_codon:yes stop_codon:yes gene_type:complete
MDNIKPKVAKKLFLVIDSMTKVDHIKGVRNYINLYYELYGTVNKGLIEIYFRTRKEKFM